MFSYYCITLAEEDFILFKAKEDLHLKLCCTSRILTLGSSVTQKQHNWTSALVWRSSLSDLA